MKRRYFLLTLEQIPEYYQDRFGIYQPEFWSEHFESREPSYLKYLKKAHNKAHCTLAVEEIKEWIDVGAQLGAKMVRGSFMRHSLDEGIKSTRLLVDYAVKKRITFLSENHFDLMSDPEKHVKVAREVRNKHFGLLADFGNYPETTDRYEALKKDCC